MCSTDEIQQLLHFTNDYTLLVIDLKVSQGVNITYFSNLSKNKTRIIYVKCVIFKTVKGRVLCIRINKQCIKFFANLWSRFSNWLVKITYRYIMDCAHCLKKALLSISQTSKNSLQGRFKIFLDSDHYWSVIGDFDLYMIVYTLKRPVGGKLNYTLTVWCTLSFLHDLKEQCHEDFPVLGQFCAKIITLRL